VTIAVTYRYTFYGSLPYYLQTTVNHPNSDHRWTFFTRKVHSCNLLCVTEPLYIILKRIWFTLRRREAVSPLPTSLC